MKAYLIKNTKIFLNRMWSLNSYGKFQQYQDWELKMFNHIWTDSTSSWGPWGRRKPSAQMGIPAYGGGLSCCCRWQNCIFRLLNFVCYLIWIKYIVKSTLEFYIIPHIIITESIDKVGMRKTKPVRKWTNFVLCLCIFY